jgi:hypothetical protein
VVPPGAISGAWAPADRGVGVLGDGLFDGYGESWLLPSAGSLTPASSHKLVKAIKGDGSRSKAWMRFSAPTGFLFMRIVPVLKDIGLWDPRVTRSFEDIGVLGFADTHLDAEMANARRRRRPSTPSGSRT